ncbi:MAG: threonine ammonia-lyase [Pseudomonadota bacterium]|nr:threonine ammonia-lyase [Pseudomonadota bacterium]
MINTASIEAARKRIRDRVYLSPCAYSETLSRMTGCRLYLKLENLQMTGSFKDRGALNRILQLSEAEKKAGVIAASAGNHAQGVANAARLIGVRAVIVMPETTPLSKIRGTQELGAEIVLHGMGYDDAFARALELADQRGLALIHAFDDAEIIAGQGTIGLELLEQVPELDKVIVPVGGGGLIAGIATAVKARRPEVEIVGVEVERIPGMQQSLAAGKVVAAPTAGTIADGIAVGKVGALTLPVVQALVNDVVAVSEEQISGAIMTLLEREKTLAEGAGAAGFAALLAELVGEVGGRQVVVVISGGNIDMNLLGRIVERGLEADGRLARMTVVVADKPGSIADLAAIVADESANIFDITQSRWLSEVKLGERQVVLELETRGADHAAAIREAIRRGGFKMG